MKFNQKIGILYDNISGNTGDVAIGLSIKKILRELEIPFDELVPGRFNPNDYEHIVIGGGYLIRNSPDFFYDKFKIVGNHILNLCGIKDNPLDLEYLNEYSYVTVRSNGDKEKLNYLKKEINVVPDSTMLLEDIDIDIKVKPNSIGIHIDPYFLSEDQEELFAKWISSLGFNIYFLPITHYSNDYNYMNNLSRKIKNSVLLPILKPQEIFTIIGKFDFFITCSLHGAIFSYVHNKPFIAANLEKINFFMADRNLEKYLFSNYSEIKEKFKKIISNPVDYSKMIFDDKKKLAEHKDKLKTILSKANIKKNTAIKNKNNLTDLIEQQNIQISHLQSNINILNSKISTFKNEHNILNKFSIKLSKEIDSKESEISKSKEHASKLSKEIDSKESEISKSKEHVSKLSKELKSKESEISKSKEHVSKLSKEIDSKESEISKSKEHVSKLSKDLKSKESEISKSKEHVSKITKELDLVKEESSRLQEEKTLQEENRKKYYVSRL